MGKDGRSARSGAVETQEFEDELVRLCLLFDRK
jgi:hypothetical protein